MDAASNTTPSPPDFDFAFSDLYPESVADLHGTLEQVAEAIDNELAGGPLVLITHELATNALQALYRLAFRRYLLEEMGLGDLDDKTWSDLYRVELGEHRAENFAAVCREHGMAIRIRGRLEEDAYRIEVENEGEPTEQDSNRVREILRRAYGPESTAEQTLAPRPAALPIWETGVGLPLVLLTLRGLGIPRGNLRFTSGRGSTVSTFSIPRSLFRRSSGGPIEVMHHDRAEQGIVWHLYNLIGYAVVRFDLHGNVKAVGEGLLERLGIAERDCEQLRAVIPARFFDDLFRGPQSIRIAGRFENYRIRLKTEDGGDSLFNVSGYLTEKAQVDTIWHEVVLKHENARLSEGSILDNLNVQRMIEPYIPSLVLKKARRAVSLGIHHLGDSVEDMTILFADLEGFTSKAEHLKHHDVMELLNQSLGVCVRSIEQNQGVIDKFMGDAVMALFKEPADSVVAALEIQNQFQLLNTFRRSAGRAEVTIRIGINCGQVIMGNIGTPQRMDWTAIGDVVNTASRIEKQARRGTVLVGESVYERVKNSVTYQEMRVASVKGKAEDLRLYEIDSIRFRRRGQEQVLRATTDTEDS